MATANEEAVRKVMKNYIEGTFKGDIDKLKACFHPKAVMNGYLNGDLLIGTIEPFFKDVSSKPYMASRNIPYKGEIIFVEITDQIASTAVRETGYEGGLSFINYFHLLFVDAQWKIISKTFTTL